MNAFALCLHSAHLEVKQQYGFPFRPTNSDILHLDDKVGGGGVGVNQLARLHQLLAAGPPPPGSARVPISVIERAFDLLDKVITADLKAVELAALINHALTASSEHDYPAAVSMGWSACEFFLNRKWRECYTVSLQDRTGGPPSNSDKRFLDGRDFTASVITQLLRISNLLDEWQVRSLDRIRKQRNGWAHSIETPSMEISVLAVELAIQLFAEAFGVEFKVNATPVGGYAI